MKKKESHNHDQGFEMGKETLLRDSVKFPFLPTPPLRRRKHFPLVILIILASTSLYLATYFHAVASRWKIGKSSQWFSHHQVEHHSDQKLKQQEKLQQQQQQRRGQLEAQSNPHIQNHHRHHPNGDGRIFESNNLIPQVINTEDSRSKVASGNGNRDDDAERRIGLEQRMSCLLPKLTPFDETIIEFIKPPQKIVCNTLEHPAYFETDFENTLIQTSEFLKVAKGSHHEIECCYRSFHRLNSYNLSNKDIIRFSKECFPITKESHRQKIPEEHEFIFIQCRNRTDFGDQTSHDDNNNLPRTEKAEKEGHKKNEKRHPEVGGEEKDKEIIFKDMFAFVHPKPQVEQRIAHYEKYKKTADFHPYQTNTNTNIDNSNSNSNQHQNPVAFKSHQYKYETPVRRQRGTMQRKNQINKDHDYFSKNVPKPEPLSNKQGDDERLNVLLLGLDAQSHMNFLRQMPLTVDFLVNNLSAIGLQGYTKVADNTFPNVVPLLTGLNTSELTEYCWNFGNPYFDDCPFLWKNFSSHGYRTLFAEDSIWMSIFTYNKPGFSAPPTDYFLHPFMDLMSKTVGHESWGNSDLCYGSKFAFQILLDYIVKTAVAFHQPKSESNNYISDKKYFQFVFVSSLFHDFLNHPKLGDPLLANTLTYLHSRGLLNSTLLVVHSDHGIRFGPIRSTFIGKIEENMPVAYFAFPKWFHKKYPQLIRNLKVNSKRLTTPFDVYKTLLDVLTLNSISSASSSRNNNKGDPNNNNYSNAISKSKRSLSLLFDVVPLTRTCQDAEIEEHYCVCDYENMVQISNETKLVKLAAEFVVHKINELLSEFQEEDYCAKLKLSKIIGALRTSPDRGSRNTTSTTVNNNIHDDNVESSNQASMEKSQSDSVSVPNNKNYNNNNNKSKSRSDNGNISRAQLQITLLTEPGNAKFEATVVVAHYIEGDEPPNISMAGEISRINLYGSKSSCIPNAVLQKYCFCIDSEEDEEERV